MDNLRIFYIDGSYVDGTAGWAYVEETPYGIIVESESGSLPTSYSSELEGLILALRQPLNEMLIYSDSKTLINAYDLRVANYIDNKKLGSIQSKSDKKRWHLIRRLVDGRKIELKWVKSHHKSYLNNLADGAANAARISKHNWIDHTSKRLRTIA